MRRIAEFLFSHISWRMNVPIWYEEDDEIHMLFIHSQEQGRAFLKGCNDPGQAQIVHDCEDALLASVLPRESAHHPIHVTGAAAAYLYLMKMAVNEATRNRMISIESFDRLRIQCAAEGDVVGVIHATRMREWEVYIVFSRQQARQVLLDYQGLDPGNEEHNYLVVESSTLPEDSEAPLICMTGDAGQAFGMEAEMYWQIQNVFEPNNRLAT